MGARRRCCCGNPICFDWSDDFDRAASTNLGADWHEEVGDWEIIGDSIAGWLHELAGTEPGTEGTANAKVMCTQAVPATSAGEMQVTVSIVDPVIGDKFYIYLACTDIHGAGGESVEYWYTDTHEWRVTLSTGEFQVQHFIPPAPLDTTTPVIACIDSDGFFYGAIASSGDEFPWNDGDATGAGRYAGLGHNNVIHGAVFDDFRIRELRTATQDCVTCFCHCGSLADRNNVKKTLLLTIYDATERALCMDARQVEMNWTWNMADPIWTSDVLRVDSQTGGSTAFSNFQWIFRCGSHDPSNPFNHFSLEWAAGYKLCCAGNPGGCNAVHLPIDEACTCTPLSVAFGPFELSVGELTCNACWDYNDPNMAAIPPAAYPPWSGEYFIAITEKP
jgi:hypothetical protein